MVDVGARRPKYFTPSEVSTHNTLKDIWVSFLGKVYDLTPLCKAYAGNVLLKPIIEAAGKDISHWFDRKTKEIRTHIDPETNCMFPYTPRGRYIHIPPRYPSTDWDNDFGRPWWKDDSFCIGRLSAKTRKVRVINTMTSQEQILEVCSEEILSEIQQRYVIYNSHAASYTWKYSGENLQMEKNLEENGITDESEDFYILSMNEDQYLPAIHLYFNDDLTD